MDLKLEAFISTASKYLYELYMLSSDYMWMECKTLNKKGVFIRNQLYLNAHLSSESILILIGNRKLWDAEILNRNILEWTIKYLYICIGDLNDNEIKLSEFCDFIPDFNAVKRSEKVEKLIAILDDSEKVKFQPILDMVLDDNSKQIYRRNLSKKQRKLIEEKWSFNKMIESLKSYEAKYEILINLSHQYAMSSHLVHMDFDAINIIWERTQRQQDEYNALNFSHSLRIISDICTLAYLRNEQVFKILGHEETKLKDIKRKYLEFFNNLEKDIDSFGEKYYT